jgi:glutamine amidotransferase-like uncharacterized protein
VVGLSLALWVLAGPAAITASEPAAAAADTCPKCVADFALYDPAYEDDGVWEEDVTALESIFRAYGFTWRKVDAAALARGALGSGKNRRFRALVEPGGWAYTRDTSLGVAGVAKVRSFIASGGAYVGFCAGAWAAVSTARWDYYGYGWYQSYPYNLRLFDGSGVGPFGWTPWNDGLYANLVEVAVDTNNPTMRAIGLTERTRFLYGGGPWFEPTKPLPGWEVWARAVAPQGAASRVGDGKPTIVRFGYGKGTVILFAYHPEVLIGSDADGVVMSYPYDESAIAWNTGDLSLERIALDSWNVAHAALQVAAGRPATPIDALPE